MLYPRESETRHIKDLSGIWNFKIDCKECGRDEKWFASELSGAIEMPVPASYNDITQDISLRDHIGDVWYQRNFFAPLFWKGQRIFLRFGSVTHKATVWLNDKELISHEGGYLPFDAEVSSLLKYGEQNRVTVVVNNVLDWNTLPPGKIKVYDGVAQEHYEATCSKVYDINGFDPKIISNQFKLQEYFHDFFNYSGIHRPVQLVIVPRTFASDITIVPIIAGNCGIVNYSIAIEGSAQRIDISLKDEKGITVASASGLQGSLKVDNAYFWEPGKPYLYQLVVKLYGYDGTLLDIYCQPVGIRTVAVSGKKLLINGKPFYFRGFGKHEDMDIKGKALDEAMLLKDFNLLRWINANSFRTSHYPYAEEVLEMADRRGIVVIDESSAVGQRFLSNNGENIFSDRYISDDAQKHHLDVMKELINRDKNHPCVIMWSIGNEPAAFESDAYSYFKPITDLTRQLDPTRPVTIVNCVKPMDCKITQLIDVICVNYYFSWYTTPGRLELIEPQLEHVLNQWYELFRKPILMAEYGADAIAGFHQDPPVMFTEEYQCEFLRRYHNVFDRLDFVIGEHVWNFADFATKQEFSRVVGNKKGVFTRQRQPKAAAHILKARWAEDNKYTKQME